MAHTKKHDGKNIDSKSVDVRNLKAIRKKDPFAESIITTSPHAALFEFNGTENKWVKTEIDGPLFVYNRIDPPLYSFMIANRQSPNDFIEPIVDLKLKYEPPYIFIYKVGNMTDGGIKGIWFYGEDECNRLHKLMVTILNTVQNDPTKALILPADIHQPDATTSFSTPSMSKKHSSSGHIDEIVTKEGRTTPSISGRTSQTPSAEKGRSTAPAKNEHMEKQLKVLREKMGLLEMKNQQLQENLDLCQRELFNAQQELKAEKKKSQHFDSMEAAFLKMKEFNDQMSKFADGVIAKNYEDEEDELEENSSDAPSS